MNDKDKKYHRFMVREALVKRTLFFAFLLITAIIGLLWFARPKTSEVEKRKLTEFPDISFSGIWNGSFFSDIDKWYSDTFPLRESLISNNSKLKLLYGIRSEQLIESSEPPAAPQDKPTDPDADLQEGLGDVSAHAETAGTIYIAAGSGYGVYNYSKSGSEKYSALISRLGKNLTGKAQVYNLIVPISAGVMLTDEIQKSIHCDDEDTATQTIFSQTDSSVKTVPVFHALKKHNFEYIYFHTDHHWTALGAYYSYREFCKVKGIEPKELSSYQTKEFSGFLGTFYSGSNQSPTLAANPDTVTAYIPNGTNKMTTFFKKGSGYFESEWRIVNDVSSYPKSELYSTFSGADEAFSYAHNDTITDGSSILVIKDSYGNAFIPFLIDHYEDVYWIDYRYYASFCSWQGKSDCTVSGLVAEKSIKDVLVINSINFTGNNSSLETMDKLYK